MFTQDLRKVRSPKFSTGSDDVYVPEGRSIPISKLAEAMASPPPIIFVVALKLPDASKQQLLNRFITEVKLSLGYVTTSPPTLSLFVTNPPFSPVLAIAPDESGYVVSALTLSNQPVSNLLVFADPSQFTLCNPADITLFINLGPFLSRVLLAVPAKYKSILTLARFLNF